MDLVVTIPTGPVFCKAKSIATTLCFASNYKIILHILLIIKKIEQGEDWVSLQCGFWSDSFKGKLCNFSSGKKGIMSPFLPVKNSHKDKKLAAKSRSVDFMFFVVAPTLQQDILMNIKALSFVLVLSLSVVS